MLTSEDSFDPLALSCLRFAERSVSEPRR